MVRSFVVDVNYTDNTMSIHEIRETGFGDFDVYMNKLEDKGDIECLLSLEGPIIDYLPELNEIILRELEEES